MADQVLFQTDDALSETNLAKWRARDNSTDYVERGLQVTPDWTNAAVDISAGHAVIKDGVKGYDVFVDSRAGLGLADLNGMNYVFLVMDPSNQDDVWFDVNADGSAPSKPSLLIQELDASAETSSSVGRQPNASYSSVEAETLSGVAETFVTTTEELESAFANLSTGETVRIAQSDTPYRPEKWLDIDTSYVTVIGESPFARDGQPLIKPADGSDVGGIRVGNSSATEHVHVERVGFHGNTNTMSGTAKRLHGFIADQNASRVTFRDNFATRTHPYHEHNSGGSGFTVRKSASHVRLVENQTHDIGDRGIQAAGKNLFVRGNDLTNGFGRSISLSVREADSNYVAKNATITNNFGRDNAEGSFIGFSGSSQRNERGYFSIVGNVASGQHYKLVEFGNSGTDVKALSAVGNVGDGQNASGVGISSAVVSEDSWVNATNNVLLGYGNGGIEVTKGHNVNIANNLVSRVGGVGIKTSGYSNHNITGNVVRYAGGPGIAILSKMSPVTVSDNQVRFCDAQGILVDQTKENSPIGGSVNGNILHSNDEGGNGVPEIDVKSENVLAVGNHIGTRGGSFSFSDSGTKNLWVGNLSPGDQSVWSLGSATSVQTMANRPSPAGKGFVLASPDGTEYEITVANDGTLDTTQL